MSDRSDAIGLASASSALPPPNNSASGFETNDQVTASTRPRAASARLARRVRFWIGVSTGLRGASPRSNGVSGTWSTPTMRTTSSTISALPSTSARQDGTATFTDLAGAGDEEAEMAEDALDLGERHVEAGEPLDLVDRKIDRPLVDRLAADHDALRRRAAAQIEHHLGREFEARHHEIRIDAALEAVARVRIDAELAAGLRDVDRLPQRRFDQHVGGVLVAARQFAAHDAGERFDALVVGDHADRCRRACRSCRRAPAIPRPRVARRTVRLPCTFSASNTCSGRPRS